MEKKNTGLIFVIVVLVVLLFGLLGYVCYDKFYLKDNNNNSNNDNKTTVEKDSTDLTKANLFNLKSIKCVSENNTCTKSLDVYYGGKNHNVKLTKKLVDKEKYGIVVYIDNEFVETLDGGKFFDWTYGNPLDPNKEDPKDFIDRLEGYLYIVDSKYLALVYRFESTDWYLVYYNGNKRANKDAIQVAGRYFGGFVKDGVGGKLGLGYDADSVLFSASEIVYWRQYCGNEIKPDYDEKEDFYYTVLEEHYVSFDGKNVKDVVNSYVTNAMAGGVSYCEIVKNKGTK